MQKEHTDPVSLVDLAKLSGESVPCGGNSPVDLDDEEIVWFVEEGSVDLFLIESKDGVNLAAPQHLLRLGSGSFIPSVVKDTQEGESGVSTLCLIAKGLPGACLKRLAVSSLSRISSSEMAQHIDLWLIALTDALSRFVTRLPRPTAFAAPDTTGLLPPGTLSSRKGVVWVSTSVQGACLFMDMVDQNELAQHTHQPVIPITRTSWISVLEEVSFSSKSTEALVQEGALFAALATFHSISFHLERLNRQLAVVDEANLERERSSSRQFAERAARTRLFNLYDLPLGQEIRVEDTNLADALQAIGRHEGIRFKIPSRTSTSDSEIELADVLDASGVRARRVRLNAESKWWRTDSTALLAYSSEDDRPLALIPGLLGSYRQFDPVNKTHTRLTNKSAVALKKDAWMFYQPLPQRPVNPVELLKVAIHGTRSDLARVLVAGFLGGLTKVFPALALGFVAAHIIGGGASEALYAVAIALVGVGL
ncbi:MAG: hypothetical protein OXG24_02705, partial [Gammaproteobacteria bacterium]|nr:hypothetical protein [Gammaproteobacteria bacterium]